MAQLTDQQIRNQVLLERLKAGTHKDFEPYLIRIDALIRDKLGADSGVIPTKARLNQILGDILSGQLSIYDEYNVILLELIEDLNIDQAAFEVESLVSVLGDKDINPPVSSTVLGALRNNPMQIQDYNGNPLLNPFIKDFTDKQIGAVQTAIRQGYAQGRTTDQIARSIRGTKARRFNDGDLARVNRSNRALVFTTLQHASTQGRMSTLRKNSDVVTGYQWVSTLDGRTSTICRSLDGNEYKVDSGPLPPIHINCRSVTVPVIDKRFNLLKDTDSDRPSVGPDGAKLVDGSETYYGWLKRQPAAFQKSAIGDARSKLLRNGGLSSEEFANLQLDKNFQPLTLKEMKAKRPEVFERANL